MSQDHYKHQWIGIEPETNKIHYQSKDIKFCNMLPFHNKRTYEHCDRRGKKKEQNKKINETRGYGIDQIVKGLSCMREVVGSSLNTTEIGHGKTHPYFPDLADRGRALRNSRSPLGNEMKFKAILRSM